MVLVLAATTAISAQGAPSQTGARFTTTIDLVSQNVTPRDGKTLQFIPDLKAGDFTVLEDGVPQKIESFTLVHGGRQLTDNTPSALLPPPGIILPQTRPPADVSGRIIFLFIDDLHIEFKLTPRMRQIVNLIAEKLIHDGDMFAVVSSGYSSIAQDPTYDRKRIPEIVDRIQGGGLTPNDIVTAASTAEGPAQVRYMAGVAFANAYDMLKQLEAIPNRQKTFIYLSSGYDFNPFPEARQRKEAEANSRNPSNVAGQTDPNSVDQSLLSNPFETQQNAFSFADLARQVSELTREAIRANVMIYTIDPRGLAGGPDLDERDVRTAEYQDNLRTSQNSLREIAEPTGGFAVVNQNDFAKALTRIDNETSDYYVLGYYSNNPDPLKRVRKVEIRVGRPNVQLVYRPEYTLKPPPKIKRN